jgi:hypothetical protein
LSQWCSTWPLEHPPLCIRWLPLSEHDGWAAGSS